VVIMNIFGNLRNSQIQHQIQVRMGNFVLKATKSFRANFLSFLQGKNIITSQLKLRQNLEAHQNLPISIKIK